ncbi:MAG: RNA pseudouridine synthase [Thermodesulforhabdaceae bacterium]
MDVMKKFIEDFRSGLAIVHEDNDLIVVSKPCGIASIPERQPTGNDLLSILSREMNRKLYVVHRLDKDVSGVIIFAKNPETHKFLNRLFESRMVEKTYVALVYGCVSEKEGFIRAPLRRFGSGRVGVDYKKGKESLTYFRVLKRYNFCTLLSVSPKTGRSHQIRVHLYHIGHPIIGDPLYGKIKATQMESEVGALNYFNHPRLMLHALSLRFTIDGTSRRFFKSSLPNDFRYILKKILACGDI